jgi:hypothetical protein
VGHYGRQYRVCVQTRLGNVVGLGLDDGDITLGLGHRLLVVALVGLGLTNPNAGSSALYIVGDLKRDTATADSPRILFANEARNR